MYRSPTYAIPLAYRSLISAPEFLWVLLILPLDLVSVKQLPKQRRGKPRAEVGWFFALVSHLSRHQNCQRKA